MIEGWVRGSIEELTMLSNVLQASKDVLNIRTSQIYKDKNLVDGKMKVTAELKPAERFVNQPRKQERIPVSGFVYLLKCDTMYKIGCARDVRDRRKLFVVNLPYESIRVIHVIPTGDMYADENALKKRFKAAQHKGTEFFDLSERQVEEFCSIEGE